MTDMRIETEGLNPGRTGAKRASWETKNPRALLLRIVQEHPNASKEAWFAFFLAELHEDTSYIPGVAQYYFANNLEAITNPAEPRPPRAREPEAEAQARVQEVQARNVEEVKVMASATVKQIELLALVQANGKRLRDCTGNECGKFGGWLAKLKNRCGARKVGDVLTEEQVRQLMGS